MPRTPGARNLDYDETRHRLAMAVARHLRTEEGMPATFKQLAGHAGVSQATLKYYFGNRDGAVAAALHAVATEGAPHLAATTEVPLGLDPRASLLAVARSFVAAWRHAGVGQLFANGVAEGLAHPAHGPATVTTIIEPLVNATEERLAVHVQRGELPADLPLREAALAFLGPLLVALLHQDPLSGSTSRPLDIDRYVETHVDLVLDGIAGGGHRPGPHGASAPGSQQP